MSYWSSQDFARQLGDEVRKLAGLLRRFVVEFADGVSWDLRSGDHTASGEVFGPLGLYATPASGGAAEAIFGAVGDSRSGVILGLRDEQTRAAAAAAADYQSGDVMLFNDTTIAILRSGSGRLDVFGYEHAGDVDRLVKVSELNARLAELRDHIHTNGAGPTGGPQTPAAVPLTLAAAAGTESIQAW